MKALNKETQSQINPDRAIEMLLNGNKRFLENNFLNRDYSSQVNDTSSGQYPFAAVLSCIDSRVPVELIFDQGIGDIFSARVAGNIVNEDMLGSIEYACKVAGSKLILVLGHSKCGAVTAACKNVELGNITALLSKIKPAVESCSGVEFDDDGIEQVIVENVKKSIDCIRKDSPLLLEMETNNEIKIAGAVYDVSSGHVKLL